MGRGRGVSCGSAELRVNACRAHDAPRRMQMIGRMVGGAAVAFWPAIPARGAGRAAADAPIKGRPGVASSPSKSASVFYHYVSGADRPATTASGATVKLLQTQPFVAAGDFHSLAELAV